MKFTLTLTHRCNLACKYCYAGKENRDEMSFATAQRAVDFAMDVTPPEQKIEFGFFGGEPFLRFDLIQEITGYIREKQKDRPIRLNVTTNGTILNQPILDFLKKEQVNLCISIDGPAHVHDRNRRPKNGQGSFATVAENLQKALGQLDHVQVNAVYDPETVDFLPETVSFFVQTGARIIHLNADICAPWTQDVYPKLRQAYGQVAEYYVQSYQAGQEIAVNLIDSKSILFLKGGYTAGDMCAMGDGEWGIAPSGNIYPCERFIGEDDDMSLCIGNVHTGLDIPRQCALSERRGNHNRECPNCEYQPYCMNWCGCTNYFMTGHTDLVGPMMCASERAMIKAARYAFVTLSQAGNELFIDHLIKYLNKGHRYPQEAV